MSKSLKLINISNNQNSYNPAVVIYHCKKCNLIRKGRFDEDVGLFLST
jgi:hypothetical protein